MLPRMAMRSWDMSGMYHRRTAALARPIERFLPCVIRSARRVLLHAWRFRIALRKGEIRNRRQGTR